MAEQPEPRAEQPEGRDERTLANSIGLGRWFGIEVGIHWSWVLIFSLVTVSLAVSYFPALEEDLGVVTYWIMGAVAAVLLFLSVLIHELAHSIVARAQGVEVNRITLFLFGGISNMQERPPSAGAEFLLTAAGPLSSFVLGGVFLGLRAGFAGAEDILPPILLYLGIINILLAVFNLIPGYPLDGGRILHSIIWAISDNRDRATRYASLIGVGVAWLFILGGVGLAFFGGGLINGLWIAFIGWFLLQAAGSRYQEASERLNQPQPTSG